MSKYIQKILEDPNEFKKISDRAFNCVDKDKNGFIDQEELEKIMVQISSEFGAEPPTKDDVKEILIELDKDNSKTIEPEEFESFIRNILVALVE